MATVVNPGSLAAPRGYSNGMLLGPGRVLFVAGQIGWNAKGELVSEEFVPQFRQALANVMDVVREAGGAAEHVGRLTIYVTDRARYLAALAEVGAAYRSVMGKHFPAMALVEVKALLEPRALVEIEGTAVIP
jgi:enamine deaminase RidA (YjgF/YER057c/UK114 family)